MKAIGDASANDVTLSRERTVPRSPWDPSCLRLPDGNAVDRSSLRQGWRWVLCEGEEGRAPNKSEARMLRILSRNSALCDGISKRECMRVGGIVLAGLSLPDSLRGRSRAAEAGRVLEQLLT